MITAIEIENFKGIRDKVRIELKPITLLFGPNSAGKSSILHALHYAREVFERRNLDADRTIAGGPFVDLGGFRNVVHGRSLSAAIRLAFDLDLAAEGLQGFSDQFRGTLEERAFAEAQERARTAHVEVAIAWSEIRSECYVREYAAKVDGEPVGTIQAQADGRNVYLTDINYRHPLLPTTEAMVALAEMAEAEKASASQSRPPRYSMHLLELPGTDHDALPDALPSWERGLRPIELYGSAADGATEEHPLITFAFQEGIARILSDLIVTPGRLLRQWLATFRYLGPIRETPPRGMTTPRSPDPSRWATGIAAWDRLVTGPDKFIDQVSDWLVDPGRLDTGYRVFRRRYKKLDLSTPVAVALISGRAFDELESTRLDLQGIPTETQIVLTTQECAVELLPSDVGIGISQVLPVIVASADAEDWLHPNRRLVMIEQPELHVHPRLQANLGDLFIESSIGSAHQFLIETHSEHLILRILRRIRESGAAKPHNGVAITGDEVAVHYVNVESGQTHVRLIVRWTPFFGQKTSVPSLLPCRSS